jgi:hypothetical protein
MRLLVLLVFLCSLGRAARISNETYQDSPIGLIYEIQLRDFLHETSIGDEANDAFIVALWDETRSNVFLWTNGPFFPPSLYRVNYVYGFLFVNSNLQGTFLPQFQTTTLQSKRLNLLVLPRPFQWRLESTVHLTIR